MRIIFLLSVILFITNQSYSQSYEQVSDIVSGSGGVRSFPLGIVDDKVVYYIYSSSGTRNEIWVSGGEPATSQMIDSYSSSFEIPTRNFVVANGNLYYLWDNDTAIYKYDGSTVTTLVSGVQIEEIVWYNDDVYYIDEEFQSGLWKVTSDPTSPEFIFNVGNRNMVGMIVYNGEMMILAGEETFGSADAYLITSDGTAAGTQRVVNLGGDSNIDFPVQFLEGGDGNLYFYNQTNTDPVSFYKTDGTSTGTVNLAATYNWTSSTPVPGIVRQIWNNGKVYMSGSNPDGGSEREFWVSDGTPSGTQFVTDLNSSTDGSDPRDFVVYGGETYFSALDSDGDRAIWKSDGTAAGTSKVLTTTFSETGSYYGEWLTVFDGKLAFNGFTPTGGSELWLSDGTDAGTFSVTDESMAGEDIFKPQNLISNLNDLYFTALVSSEGREMWRYNNGISNPIIEINGSFLEYKIFPNPFKDNLIIDFTLSDNISASEELTLEVFDLLGRSVHTQRFLLTDENIKINTSEWSSGNYFFKILNSDKILSRGKVIKRN